VFFLDCLVGPEDGRITILWNVTLDQSIRRKNPAHLDLALLLLYLSNIALLARKYRGQLWCVLQHVQFWLFYGFPVTAEARVRSQSSSCGICFGWSDSGQVLTWICLTPGYCIPRSYTSALHPNVAHSVSHKWRHAFYVTRPLLCARITSCREL
jgi:hypothetical protein